MRHHGAWPKAGSVSYTALLKYLLLCNDPEFLDTHIMKRPNAITHSSSILLLDGFWHHNRCGLIAFGIDLIHMRHWSGKCVLCAEKHCCKQT